MSALKIDALVKLFPGRDAVRAVDGVSLDVPEGELLVRLGPSGCGKTTLLRCIAGLEDAQEGRIMLDSKPVFDAATRLNVPTHKRDIGMVFQNYSLWPHMSVRRNVEYPLRARRFESGRRAARVDEVLGIVQCTHLADRLPSMLSGGQQQRIALARAMASKPAVMLLDEPLSNLDALLREELRSQLRLIHRDLGFTGIYVTHDQTEAFTLGTRVAVMNSGVIEQLGTASEVNARPQTEYVARFLGIRNALDISFDGAWTSAAGPLGGDLSLLGQGGDGLRIFVRPEDVLIAAAGKMVMSGAHLNLAGGVVEDSVQVGHEMTYMVRMGGTLMHVHRARAEGEFRPGEAVDLMLPHADVLLYKGGKLAR